jgi:hypothetical protein
MKLTGENRQLGEKPVPVPLCPPQISHGLDLGSNPGLRGEYIIHTRARFLHNNCNNKVFWPSRRLFRLSQTETAAKGRQKNTVNSAAGFLHYIDTKLLHLFRPKFLRFLSSHFLPSLFYDILCSLFTNTCKNIQAKSQSFYSAKPRCCQWVVFWTALLLMCLDVTVLSATAGYILSQ